MYIVHVNRAYIYSITRHELRKFPVTYSEQSRAPCHLCRRSILTHDDYLISARHAILSLTRVELQTLARKNTRIYDEKAVYIRISAARAGQYIVAGKSALVQELDKKRKTPNRL